MSEISSTFHFDVSVVLATKRKEQIDFALSQILPQENCRIELVVACHGFTARELVANLEEKTAGQTSVTSVKVIEAPVEESFGSVLNRASLACTKRFTTKWDDDDYYGSRHLIGLYVALNCLGSDFIGRPANFVELESSGTILFRRAGREFAETKSIAGGTIFSRTASLYGAGGWGNLSSGVDQHLLKHAVRRGFRVHSADANSFVLVRKPRGHTWDASEAYFYAAGAHEMPTNYRRRILEGGVVSGHAKAIAHSPAKSVSVCVPFHNNALALARQIEHYESVGGIELVFVDDRSDPPLEFPSSGIPDKGLRIKEGKGFGAGLARNRAASESTGEILVFHDSDVLIDEEVFTFTSEMMADFDVVHGEIGFVHGENPFEARSDTAVRDLHWDQSWREEHWRASYDLAEYTNTSYRSTVGGFLAVKRAIHEAIGGFRDVRIQGVEDTEYGFRLLQYGVRQTVYRGDGIQHLGERTFSRETTAHKVVGRGDLLRSYIPNFYRDGIFVRNGIEREKDFLFLFVDARDKLSIVDADFWEISLSESFESVLDCPLAMLVADDSIKMTKSDLLRLGEMFTRPGTGIVVLLAGARRVGAVVSFGRLNEYLRSSSSSVISSSFDLKLREVEIAEAVSHLTTSTKVDILVLDVGR